MKLFDAFRAIIVVVEPLCGAREASAVAYRLLEDKYGITRGEFILEPNQDIDFDTRDVERLAQCEPVQYIVGHSDFCGRRFGVQTGVLIPRPETQELIMAITENLPRDFDGTIIDVGTGSGAIAITLALEFPRATINAIDISNQALDVARVNAVNLSANVNFIEADIFEVGTLDYDVVVSNPPYVLDSERAQMAANVLKFEPHTALFVTDADPLIFYREIAQKAQNCNAIFFEINENFGAQTAELLSGWDVQIVNDINEKARICIAKK